MKVKRIPVRRAPGISQATHIIIAAACLATTAPALAQAFPTRAIRIVVPFTPGAGTDVVARAVAGKITPMLGQNVIVENRPGAGGTVGSEIVAHAPKDGYTILMGNTSTLAIAPALYRRLPYDPLRDFAPVALVTTTENVIVVHPSLPARSVKDLIALARAKPGEILYASAGSGTTSHLGGALFRSMAKIDIVHVPYKGSPLALTELLAGQTQMSVASLSSGTPHIASGRLRAIATTGLKRNALLPAVPTVDESGLKGYEINLWQGFVVPAGTPQATIDRLNAAMVDAVRAPDISSLLARGGMLAGGSSAPEFAAYIKREHAKWAGIVERAGARVE
jgi:tripartite-type tricarboxylate transporter receptor subunit TctC